MPRLAVTLVLLWGVLFSLHAQSYGWQDFLSEITSLSEEEAESDEWLQYVQELQVIHENPFNINTATVADLQQLPFLNQQQIEAIHAYIYLHGQMQTLGELKLVPTLDAKARRCLPLFVYAGKPEKRTKFSDLFAHLRHDFSTRLDIPLYYRRGYMLDKGGYRGDPLYHRIRYNIGNQYLQAAVRLEKDPGERFYDSHGGYVMLQQVGIFQRAIVGDYRAAFGEGLVFGGGSWHTKSAPTLHPQGGLRPMTSMSESGFFRGAAATLQLAPQWQLTALFSRQAYDATLTPRGEVQTLITSGQHRTETEYAKLHNTHATLFGADVTWAKDKFYVGTTGYYQTFDRPLQPGTAAYRAIYPRGYDFGVAGLHYGFRWRDLIVGGETSLSMQHTALATTHRATYIVNARHRISLVQRYYDEQYYSFHASAMGESSRVQNENGVLLHWQGEPWSGWQLAAYTDFFYHRWPTYGMRHSNSGQECMAQIGYTPVSRHTLTFTYRFKTKETYDTPDPHHRLQAQWTFLPSKPWRIQLRGALHQTVDGCGYGLSAVVGQEVLHPSLRWSCSMAYAHTPSYLARIYFYEPSLYQTVSSLSLYGQSLRATATLRWTTWKGRMMLEGRYALLHYFDREEQSSGLQTIYSPSKSDVQLQVRLRI